ncbi:MAG: DsbA family protein [Candidatus Limnocylindria bacterium]
MSRRPRQPRGTPTTPPARGGPSRAQLAIAAAVAILAVAAVIVIGGTQSAAPPPPVASGLLIAGNVMGEANAPVTIEEWADFQCPACRAFALGTEPELRTAYIATGKVRFVFHHMAFIGQESIWAGEAVECAGEQNRFWDLHDRLYASQGGENTGTFSKPNLEKIASSIGLGAGFNACLESDRYAQRVRDDTAAGQAKGVTATPTLFVNGRKLQGVLSFDQLRAIIDPLIK